MIAIATAAQIPSDMLINTLAEGETTIANMSFGEFMVSISTVALVVVTVVMIWVSWMLIKVTRRDAEMVAKANEIAMHELGNVAVNANDDMAEVATAAIDSVRPDKGVAPYVHGQRVYKLRKMTRKTTAK